jgi:hypothetical protein
LAISTSTPTFTASMPINDALQILANICLPHPLIMDWQMNPRLDIQPHHARNTRKTISFSWISL